MSSLDDILGDLLPKRGRPAVPPAVVGELTERDIASLSGQRAGPPPVPLQRIREAHHQLARLVAEGRPAVEVSALTGYTPERIHTLKQDPAFRELVEFYRQQKDAKYLDMHGRLATLGATAIQELQDRLEDTPEDLSVGELNELVKTTLDRAGFGPKSTRQVDVKFGVDDEILAKIKSSIRPGGSVRTVEEPLLLEATND